MSKVRLGRSKRYPTHASNHRQKQSKHRSTRKQRLTKPNINKKDSIANPLDDRWPAPQFSTACGWAQEISAGGLVLPKVRIHLPDSKPWNQVEKFVALDLHESQNVGMGPQEGLAGGGPFSSLSSIPEGSQIWATPLTNHPNQANQSPVHIEGNQSPRDLFSEPSQISLIKS